MGKRNEIIGYIKDNKKLVMKFIKVYNKLCPDCKKKLSIYRYRNQDLPFNKMCGDCKKMSERELQ